MASVCFKDFSFQYDNLKNPTLKNINLTLHEGEKVLIAGPSGSGKSTLAHCINGLIPFAYGGKISGECLIADTSIQDKSLYEISNTVGTILQDSDGQFVALSVGEDVAFALENNNVSTAEMRSHTLKTLTSLNMENWINASPQNLSGGQKQKVAMAGVLTMNAPILLFDEPLANLDPLSGQRAMEAIDEIYAQGNKTIIVIEHRIEDVLTHHFDRLVIFHKGEIVFNGTPDEALRTSALKTHGLREPLYIETLKFFGINLSEEKSLTHLESLKKYSDSLKEKINNTFVAPKNFAPKETLLKVEDLSFSYAKNEPLILKDISFSIQKGEFISLLGNNGAGKSTLLKLLTGFCKPNKGKIFYEGKNISKYSIKKRAESIGYVMQNPNHMITQYMIYDEISFGLRNFGYKETEIPAIVDEVLEVCNLTPFKKWPISSLSFGQKKRVTIASILALKPQIIILDEPTAGQDHRSYTEFMTFLRSLKESGMTVVMITHDIQLALEYSDRSLVLSQGELILDDSIYTVLSKPSILKQANLKETSIHSLGRLFEIDDLSGFLETSIAKGREALLHE